MITTKTLTYLGLTVLCFLSCVIIVVFFDHNPFIRGSLGDVVIVMLIYFMLKTIHDFRPPYLALFVLLVAVIVEIGQYLDLVGMLGIQESYVTRIVFGSVFEFGDLLAYAVGVSLAFLLDTKILPKVLTR